MPNPPRKRELVLRVSIDLDTGAVLWTRETSSTGQAGADVAGVGAPPGPLSESLGKVLADVEASVATPAGAAAALAAIGVNNIDRLMVRYSPSRIMEVIHALPPPARLHETAAAWVCNALFRGYTMSKGKPNGRI
jgi:hypothetical protein